MLKKILDHKLRTLLVIVLVGLLAAVRAFENTLFYDPFLDFFRGEFGTHPLPLFDTGYLFVGLFCRYSLNSLISLAILYLIFKESELIKFSALLYLILFVVLLFAFFGIIYFMGNGNNLALFYVRRFLIQPLFVVLFIPAFYYQNHISKK